MDNFPGDLSYCLHLQIGLGFAEVDQGGRLTGIGSVRETVVLEGDPAPDQGLGLRCGFPGVQVDALVL